MPPLRRFVLGLNAATVLLVIGGIVLLVLPPRLPTAASVSMVASTGGLPDSVRQAVAPDLDAADRVVRTDIFSPRRSAPPRRYQFGESVSEAETTPDEPNAGIAMGGEAADSTSPSTATDKVPHLYGTMMGPSGATALLRLDDAVAGPRLFRVGDRAGGYRVVDVGERSVTLAGPSGRVVLRLNPPDQ